MSQHFVEVAVRPVAAPGAASKVARQLELELGGSIKLQVDARIDPKMAAELAAIRRSAEAGTAALERMTAAAAKPAAALDKTATSARSAAAAVKQLNELTARGTTEAERFGQQVGLAAKRFASFTVATAGVFALSAALSKGVGEAVAFDLALNKLRQVSDGATSEIRAMGREIGDLSVRLGVSSKELAEVSVQFAQAGLTAGQTRQALQAVAQTALAPNFENMKQTTEGAIAAFQQFGRDAGRLKEQLGAMNAVAGAFAVEAQDLVVATQKAGGSFAALGGDLNELLGLFTSVRATTRESAESIATGLRTIFARLQRQDTVDALEALRINLRYTRTEAEALGQTDLAGQFVGAYEAVRRLSEGLEGLRTTDPRFAQVTEQLGGYRQISRVIPLLQQFGEAQKAVNVARLGGVSLAINEAQRMEAVSNRITRMGEAWQKVFNDAGQSRGVQQLADALERVVTALAQATSLALPLAPVLSGLAIGAVGMGAFRAARGVPNAQDYKPHTPPPRRFASGGLVPGVGNTDSVPLTLPPGAFVVRKQAVQALGANNLAALGKKYAGGGSAAAGGTPALVMPGEYIFEPNEARSIGYGRLYGLNAAGRGTRPQKLAGGGLSGFVAAGVPGYGTTPHPQQMGHLTSALAGDWRRAGLPYGFYARSVYSVGRMGWRDADAFMAVQADISRRGNTKARGVSMPDMAIDPAPASSVATDYASVGRHLDTMYGGLVGARVRHQEPRDEFGSVASSIAYDRLNEADPDWHLSYARGESDFDNRILGGIRRGNRHEALRWLTTLLKRDTGRGLDKQSALLLKSFYKGKGDLLPGLVAADYLEESVSPEHGQLFRQLVTEGGQYGRFAAGGRVPGSGFGDKTPALLEAGEHVVRRDAAQANRPLLDALNATGRLPRFADGGVIRRLRDLVGFDPTTIAPGLPDDDMAAASAMLAEAIDKRLGSGNSSASSPVGDKSLATARQNAGLVIPPLTPDMSVEAKRERARLAARAANARRVLFREEQVAPIVRALAATKRESPEYGATLVKDPKAAEAMLAPGQLFRGGLAEYLQGGDAGGQREAFAGIVSRLSGRTRLAATSVAQTGTRTGGDFLSEYGVDFPRLLRPQMAERLGSRLGRSSADVSDAMSESLTRLTTGSEKKLLGRLQAAGLDTARLTDVGADPQAGADLKKAFNKVAVRLARSVMQRAAKAVGDVAAASANVGAATYSTEDAAEKIRQLYESSGKRGVLSGLSGAKQGRAVEVAMADGLPKGRRTPETELGLLLRNLGVNSAGVTADERRKWFETVVRRLPELDERGQVAAVEAAKVAALAKKQQAAEAVPGGVGAQNLGRMRELLEARRKQRSGAPLPTPAPEAVPDGRERVWPFSANPDMPEATSSLAHLYGRWDPFGKHSEYQEMLARREKQRAASSARVPLNVIDRDSSQSFRQERAALRAQLQSSLYDREDPFGTAGFKDIFVTRQARSTQPPVASPTPPPPPPAASPTPAAPSSTPAPQKSFLDKLNQLDRIAQMKVEAFLSRMFGSRKTSPDEPSARTPSGSFRPDDRLSIRGKFAQDRVDVRDLLDSMGAATGVDPRALTKGVLVGRGVTPAQMAKYGPGFRGSFNEKTGLTKINTDESIPETELARVLAHEVFGHGADKTLTDRAVFDRIVKSATAPLYKRLKQQGASAEHMAYAAAPAEVFARVMEDAVLGMAGMKNESPLSAGLSKSVSQADIQAVLAAAGAKTPTASGGGGKSPPPPPPAPPAPPPDDEPYRFLFGKGGAAMSPADVRQAALNAMSGGRGGSYTVDRRPPAPPTTVPPRGFLDIINEEAAKGLKTQELVSKTTGAPFQTGEAGAAVDPLTGGAAAQARLLRRKPELEEAIRRDARKAGASRKEAALLAQEMADNITLNNRAGVELDARGRVVGPSADLYAELGQDRLSKFAAAESATGNRRAGGRGLFGRTMSGLSNAYRGLGDFNSRIDPNGRTGALAFGVGAAGGFAAQAVAPNETQMGAVGRVAGADSRAATGIVASSALNAAALGAGVGAAGGPIGLAVGAVVGASIGIATGLKDASRQIAEAKIGVAIEDLGLSLGRVTRGLSGLNDLSDVVGSVESLREQAAAKSAGEVGSNSPLAEQRASTLKQIRLAAGPQLFQIGAALSKETARLAKENPGLKTKDAEEKLRGSANVTALAGLLADLGVYRDTNEAFRELTKETVKASQAIKVRTAVEESRAEASRATAYLGRLAEVAERAASGLDGARDRLDALAGGRPAPRSAADNLAMFGVDPERRMEALAGLRAQGQVGGAFAERLQDLASAADALPEALASLAGLPPNQDAGNALSGLLGGQNRQIASALANALDEAVTKDGGSLQKLLSEGVEPLARQLIGQLADPTIAQARRFEEVRGAQRQFLFEGFGRAEGLAGEARGFRGDAGRLDAQAADFARAQRARAGGFDPTDLASVRDLTAPFRASQNALLEGTGVDAEASPAALAARLREVEGARLTALGTRNTAQTATGIFEAEKELARLADVSARVKTALENVAKSGDAAAAAQQKISAVDSSLNDRRSVAERALFADPAERAQMGRQILSAQAAARNKGGFATLDLTSQRDVIAGLNQLGASRLPTGERADELKKVFLDQLLPNGQGALQQKELGERAAAEKEFVEALKTQRDAVGELAKSADTRQATFLTELKGQFDRFFAQTEKGFGAAALGENLNAVQLAKGEVRNARAQSSAASFLKKTLGVENDQQLSAAQQLTDQEVRDLVANRRATLAEEATRRRFDARPSAGVDFALGREKDAEARQFGVTGINYLSSFGTQSYSSKDIETGAGAFLDNLGFEKNSDLRLRVAEAAARRLKYGNAGEEISPANIAYAITSQAQRVLDEADAFGGETGARDQDMAAKRYFGGDIGKFIEATGNRRSGLARYELQQRTPGVDLGRIADLDDTGLSRFLESRQALQNKKLADVEAQRIEAEKKLQEAADKLPPVDPNNPLDKMRREKLLGFAAGGWVGGGKGSPHARGTDTVPAVLAPDEFVVDARTAKANAPLLEWMRGSGRPVYRAGGGFVGPEVAAMRRRQAEKDAAAAPKSPPPFMGGAAIVGGAPNQAEAGFGGQNTWGDARRAGVVGGNAALARRAGPSSAEAARRRQLASDLATERNFYGVSNASRLAFQDAGQSQANMAAVEFSRVQSDKATGRTKRLEAEMYRRPTPPATPSGASKDGRFGSFWAATSKEGPGEGGAAEGKAGPPQGWAGRKESSTNPPASDQKLSSAMDEFNKKGGRLADGFVAFGQKVDKLVEALEKIPQSIKMEATAKHEVVLNDGGLLAKLGDFEAKILAAAESMMDSRIDERVPDSLKPPRRDRNA